MSKCNCRSMTAEEFLTWDLSEQDWTGKTFYQVRVPMIAHFPVAPELKIPKVLNKIEAKGFGMAESGLIIFNDGVLVGQLMVEVEPTEQKDANLRRMSSTKVISKVYQGPRHLVPKALKEFDRYLMSRRMMTNDFYFWFLNCQQCNHKNSESKTIIFAKV